MGYRERLPDWETDMLKGWKMRPDEKKEVGNAEENSVTVEYKGQKFGLCGFTVYADPKTDMAEFALKWRHDTRNLMYYVFVDNERTRAAVEMCKFIGEQMANYRVLDAKDIFEEAIKGMDLMEEKGNESKDSEG